MTATEERDYEFVEELPEELTCSICMKLLCQPHMVNCCGQQFCEDCLKQWQRQKKTCPHCRSTDISHMLMKQTSRKIGELKIYCPNKKHGCESILKICESNNHVSLANAEGCQYVLVGCPYNCSETLSVPRCLMDKHKESLCPRRPVNCVHCELQGEHEVITGEHVKTCSSYPLDCPQECGATVLRKDLKAHKDTCPEGLVACPFSELGCKVKVHRKDLEKHVETSAVQHMTVLAQSHLSLKAEHTALKKSYEEVNSRLNAATAQLPKTVESVRKNHHEIASELSKLYPLLTDTSVVKMGDSLVLGLSETNEMFGYHHIKVSNSTFRLEWKKVFTEKHTPSPKLRRRRCSQGGGFASTLTSTPKTKPGVFPAPKLTKDGESLPTLGPPQPKASGGLLGRSAAAPTSSGARPTLTSPFGSTAPPTTSGARPTLTSPFGSTAPPTSSGARPTLTSPFGSIAPPTSAGARSPTFTSAFGSTGAFTSPQKTNFQLQPKVGGLFGATPASTSSFCVTPASTSACGFTAAPRLSWKIQQPTLGGLAAVSTSPLGSTAAPTSPPNTRTFAASISPQKTEPTKQPKLGALFGSTAAPMSMSTPKMELKQVELDSTVAPPKSPEVGRPIAGGVKLEIPVAKKPPEFKPSLSDATLSFGKGEPEFKACTFDPPKNVDHYQLKLYLLVDNTHPALPKTWNCDVESMHEGIPVLLAVIRAGVSQSVLPGEQVNTDHSLQLLGMISSCQSDNKELEIKFSIRI